MSNEFSEMRAEYEVVGLDVAALASDPITQFRAWFDAAVRSGCREPNTMTLATVAVGKPAARTVLLKGLDTGFLFYTNYDSDKGRQIAVSPQAALTFYWQALHRQVRVEGPVAKVSAEESDAYFRSRPRGAQLAAAASAQSRLVVDRATLHAQFAHLEGAFEGRDVPRPLAWGGYRVAPERVEFWQGQVNRLHDRLVYERTSDGWSITRLNP